MYLVGKVVRKHRGKVGEQEGDILSFVGRYVLAVDTQTLDNGPALFY